jgi:hypothetical protein
MRAQRWSSAATSRSAGTRAPRACCAVNPSERREALLVYIEFISRRPGVSVEAFHFAAGRGQTGWSSEHSDDVLLLNLGRTFRTGPEPEYVAVWYTPAAGLERVGEWERIFASGEADHLEETFRLAARIDRAGCYEPLLEPVPGRDGLYYGEYLDVAPSATREELAAFFESRRDRHDALTLNLACDRIGGLGPGPRCLAVWTLPGWEALDSIARDLDGVDDPVRLIEGALYRDLGAETL